MRFSPKRVSGLAFSGGLLALILAGCGEKPQMNPGMPQVSVITIQPQRAPIVSELPGRVDAVRDAQIRARVTGIVQKIAFEQGGDVKENQLLFKIDPAPYKAAYDQATAQLKQAQANLFSAKLLADRYAPLVKANAVSKQEYDNAVASYRQADAAVAAAKAAQDNAAINLGYTDVTSPITGRIGKPLVTEGALVETTSATQMATVQQLDPIYVDFTQSTAQLASLRRAFASGQLQQVGKDTARATIVLEDGSEYSQPGKLLFTGITVDPTTGQVNLRAEVPNPDGILLPGMYVRVRLEQGVDDKALMVPQQALQRTADGLQSLLLVKDNKIEQIPVTTGGALNSNWIVTSGLKAGDVVVVEGFQKVRPGAPVQASEWKNGTPAPGGQAPAQPGAKPAESAPQPGAKPAEPAQQDKAAGQKS
ncbi:MULTISPECIES: efflux RND transporter periplasmic adaptor subunit [Achromobacter]|uniref:Efflux RND transporter periplasmic adaptor subunit n=1 Tax=Alcaligenes xylosoxydans xylosoxydans TaxID=85698 RepID=A0A424WET4_ALCXX|nr:MULTISPECIES: efflux RND transporter periplasmic adaptor subunit [Achromobacter]MBC9904502.1 efflux RND transporter periplasmic adaptor subunit [Achromobacter xylosoxidans]MBD0869447.1 efflux RND transporter periplasmic adaptor subunit [Achromobacter xylosoxidans]QNP88015.1 efflux RND transporter periplasmic adaptor subunit [Achromobacter xylosoxidans]RPJ91750.1 efflux RND transporter periplasmic adaptor subunit [Achromobacter xylosoxidans]